MAIQGLPGYYVGRRLYSARITPINYNLETGAMTKGATADMASSSYLTAREMVFDQKANAEEIHPANWSMENNVPTTDGFDVVLREIKYADPSNNALPFSGWVNTDYFLAEVVVSPDNGTTRFTVQAVCRRAAMTDGYGPGEGEFELHGDTAGLPIAYVPAGEALVY